MSLPRGIARRLRAEARASGRSASAIVGEALQGYFDRRPEPRLPSFVGIGDSGHTDTSERVDEIIAEILERRFPRRRR